MSLKPLETNTLADTVESRLHDYIKRESLKPGDALPGELELARALDVSRNVIREALSRLRMLGMVRSRKRRGMVISRPEFFIGLGRVAESGLLEETDLGYLFELRLVMELGLADLIFLRMRPEDLAELEAIVEREESDPANRQVSLDCDVEFHAVLYRLTRNTALTRFHEILRPFFHCMRGQFFSARRFEEPDRVTHRDLLEILKHGTVEEYRSAVRKSLAGYLDQLAERE